MFDAVENGRKISRDEFDQEEMPLRTALLEVQREFKNRRIPLIVVIAGIEGAGTGLLIDRLNEWLGARGVEVHGFLEESTQEERERPAWWKYWRLVPARGTIALVAGGWYREPLLDLGFGRRTEDQFDAEMERINHFESMLTVDGAVVIKFWMHLTKKEQKRVREEEKKGGWTSPYLKPEARNYDALTLAAERAIRLTDSGESPWHLVAARRRRSRELEVGRKLLAAMQARLQASPVLPAVPDPKESPPHGQREAGALDAVNFGLRLDPDEYKERLDAAQNEMRRLAWEAYGDRRTLVAVFEGIDAAGKGGAIRRLTRAVDARICDVNSIVAPSDEETARHYVWRFWRLLPRGGHMAVFDRSWYGRVLVERVEGFATFDEWRRAYREINDFEHQLHESGIVLCKFWLHIDADEQLRRFNERAETPWKRHKLTDEDWRNREKREAYELAVDEMVARTSTEFAPWHVIPANDKKYARVAVLETICGTMAEVVPSA